MSGFQNHICGLSGLAFNCPACEVIRDDQEKEADGRHVCATANVRTVQAMTAGDLGARLRQFHQGIERECWKQHPSDFIVCEQPACMLLKELAKLAGWSIELNGVDEPKVDAALAEAQPAPRVYSPDVEHDLDTNYTSSLPAASAALRRPQEWTAEQEVEAVKQQLPDGAWKQGASLARCVEDLRMDRDALARQLQGSALRRPTPPPRDLELAWRAGYEAHVYGSRDIEKAWAAYSASFPVLPMPRSNPVGGSDLARRLLRTAEDLAIFPNFTYGDCQTLAALLREAAAAVSQTKT